MLVAAKEKLPSALRMNILSRLPQLFKLLAQLKCKIKKL